MILADLFEVENYSVTEKGFSTSIKLNAKHIVYSGHFPGHPVTPGVIQLYIVHNLLEKHFAKKIQLKTIFQCKFLKSINPVENSNLLLNINIEHNEDLLTIYASGANELNVFFKLNAVYNFI